jgi:DNA modification methylase
MFRDRVKELRRVPARELIPNRSNWRTHPQSQRTALDAILKEVGYAGALLARELPGGQLQIIDGHLRAETTPDQEVPVLVLDVTEEEADKILLTFDPLAAMAEADEPTLRALLDSVKFDDVVLRQLAEAQLPNYARPGETDPDEVPEPPKVAKTKPGDLYLLGDHRLLCGDSTKAEDLSRLNAGLEADLLLTDPPYNVDYEGATKQKLSIANDAMDESSYHAFLTAAFSAAAQKLKQGAAFYFWHADTHGLVVRHACSAAGLVVRQCLIWTKSSLVMGRQDYQWQHEPCLYGWKDGAPHTWLGDRSQTTLLEFTKPTRNAEHPTMKPVALFAYLTRNSCKPGGLVLDPFLGSGTAIIAAEQLGRRCFEIEIDPIYCDVIVARWQNFTGKVATLEAPPASASV